MKLTSKFKKDIGILQAAANKEILFGRKESKTLQKVKRYYVGEGLVNLSGEDPRC